MSSSYSTVTAKFLVHVNQRARIKTVTLLWDILVDKRVMVVMLLTHRGMHNRCWLRTLLITHSCVVSLLGGLRWHIQIMCYFVKTTKWPSPPTAALESFQSLVLDSDPTYFSISCWHSNSLGNFSISSDNNISPCSRHFYDIVNAFILISTF